MLTKQKLRDISNNSKIYEWLSDIPYEVRDCGITYIFEARKSPFGKVKKKIQRITN